MSMLVVNTARTRDLCNNRCVLMEKLNKPYNPQSTEDRIYKLWEDSGFFNPDECIKAGVAGAGLPVGKKPRPAKRAHHRDAGFEP